MINISELLKIRELELDRENRKKEIAKYLEEIGLEKESTGAYVYRKNENGLQFIIKVVIKVRGFEVECFNRFMDIQGQWDDKEMNQFYTYTRDSGSIERFENDVKNFIAQLL